LECRRHPAFQHNQVGGQYESINADLHAAEAQLTALASAASAIPQGSPIQPDIDLDANATTRPLEAVVALVARVMRSGSANPSSAHWLGGAARSVLEQARDGVASLLPGILPEAVIFG